MSKTRVLITAVVLISCMSRPAVYSKNRQVQPGPEDYAIYSVLINNIVDDEQMLLISESTNSNSNAILTVSEILVPELLLDFQKKNLTNCQLERKFNLRTKYAIIREEDERDLFESGSKIVTLSRIGFSHLKREAMVQIRVRTGPLNDKEYYVVLARIGDEWQVSSKVGTVRPVSSK